MKRWQQIALVALAYFGLAWLGLQVATVADQVTLLWAPAGIARNTMQNKMKMNCRAMSVAYSVFGW